MLTIESLKNLGADTDEGLGRCFGNEDFYLRLVRMIPGDGNFDALKDSLEQRDLDKAFEAAHALKGVLGNLSLTPMYEKASEITELLRARKNVDYAPLLSELLNMRDELLRLCAD